MKIELPDGCRVLLDDLWYMYVTKWKWKHHPYGYVYRHEGTGKDVRLVFLHRVVAEAQAGEQVRFLNKNPLDCREENLKKIRIKDAN